MKTTLTITFEGCEDCHPSDEEMTCITSVFKWILAGKMCADQEITLNWSSTE